MNNQRMNEISQQMAKDLIHNATTIIQSAYLKGYNDGLDRGHEIMKESLKGVYGKKSTTEYPASDTGK